MASRILGMGDVVTLVEKAQEAVSLEEALNLEGKLTKNRFTFEDLVTQIKQIKKMGSLESLLSMIPGLGKQLKGVNIDDKAFVRVEAIISSMTMQEKRNYVILNGSRKKRIAAGSGTSVTDVNRLVKQHLQMKKMMKKMKRGKGLSMPQFKF
jgi:signal recognition particle subunit SRP54